MTKEEIKGSMGMAEVLQRYRLTASRGGMIDCPFHSDKTPSMKIYKDGFFCFGCGANGDIFSFVMRMDDLTFSEAFLDLGGTYEKPDFKSRLAIYKGQKQREMARNKLKKEQKEKSLNNTLISVYRHYIEQSDPLSECWRDSYNALQYQLHKHKILNEPRW